MIKLNLPKLSSEQFDIISCSANFLHATAFKAKPSFFLKNNRREFYQANIKRQGATYTYNKKLQHHDNNKTLITLTEGKLGLEHTLLSVASRTFAGFL